MAIGPLLPLDITADDLASGAVWGSRFIDRVSEIRKGAYTFAGEPSIDRGITLNGTDESILYTTNNLPFESSDQSIQVVFYPDQDYDEDAVRFLFTIGGAGVTYVSKEDNGDSNALRIFVSGTLIVDVASATYGPLWKVGQRNVLTVASQSGDTDAWFNGTQIVTADATAWSATPQNTLYVGQSGAGAWFDGKFEMLMFYSVLLTVSDHQALVNARGLLG
jgi:hypothetical protein